MNLVSIAIVQNIEAERGAIKAYSALLPLIKNGNHRRSIKHILNEEKDHLKILENIQAEIGLNKKCQSRM